MRGTRSDCLRSRINGLGAEKSRAEQASACNWSHWFVATPVLQSRFPLQPRPKTDVFQNKPNSGADRTPPGRIGPAGSVFSTVMSAQKERCRSVRSHIGWGTLFQKKNGRMDLQHPASRGLPCSCTVFQSLYRIMLARHLQTRANSANECL